MTTETTTIETTEPGVLTTPPVVETPVVETKTEAAPKTSLAEALYGTDDKLVEPAEAAAPETKTEKVDETIPPKEGEPTPLTVDSYKDLTIPEGLTVDDALLTQAKEVFAKVGVDPAKAPELMALYAETQKSQLASLRAEIAAQDATWVKELDAIPEFNGEQRKIAQQFIGRAIEEFGTPEVRQTLGAYGLSNNPALARFIYNMAYAISEGQPTTSGSPAPVQKNGQSGRPNLAESMYDHPDSAKARTQ